jgi:FkbM family methyltransferase
MRLGTRIRAAAARRGRSLDITLRNDRDREILAEIFSRHCYKPPRPIVARRVLDLGGNIGLFTAYALEKLGAQEIVAVEADPDNLQALREFVSNNGLPVRVVGAYAAAGEGSIEFEAGLAANSRFAQSDSDINATITVPTIDTFSLGSFDLAKIDIEGGEWPLLADERFAQLAPTVVMEWHERGKGDMRIEQALEAHGYSVQQTDRHMVWGFASSRIELA